MRPVHSLRTTLLGGLLTGALALTGCGAADEPAASQRQITVQAANGAVQIPARPERIVSLSPTATEMLFAVGAGPKVVAVDDQSTYPSDAPRTKLSGFKPNAEAVIAYKPDLVVLSDDIDGIVQALGKVKVPVLHEPAAKNLDEVYDQIGDLGTATGRSAEATALTDRMRGDIGAAVKKAEAAADTGGTENARPTYYHELDDSLHSVTSKTFIGQIYSMFGLRNIADPADEQGSGYPKLSREHLLKADPDLIFLADSKCCGQTPERVSQRPGWDALTAVREQQITALDDDVASRWGPRVTDLVKAIAAAVQKISSAE